MKSFPLTLQTTLEQAQAKIHTKLLFQISKAKQSLANILTVNEQLKHEGI